MMSALGLTPDARQRISRALASGFASMRNSPFAGEAFGSGFGGAMAGANKVDLEREARAQKAANRGIKLAQLGETAFNNRSLDAYRRANAASLSDWRTGQLGVNRDKVDVAREGLDVRRGANESLDGYRRRVLDLQLEGLNERRENNRAGRDIQREGHDIKRRAGEVDGGLPQAPTRHPAAECGYPPAGRRDAAGPALGLEQAGPADRARLRARGRRQAEGAGAPIRDRRTGPDARSAARARRRGQDRTRRLQEGSPTPAATRQAGQGGPAAPPADPTAGPVTREQYDALEPGARYQHPADPPGQFRIKGGKKPSVSAAPAV